MSTRKLIFVIILFSFLSSCFKEDVKLNAPKSGEVETMMIEIGYPYANQVYYRCSDNSIIATNNRYAWDLGFETGSNGFHIKVNTAKGVFVSDQGNIAFDEITSAVGLDWQWDASSGNLDSTAFGNWYNQEEGLSYNHLYIIDLQRDKDGNNLGYKKMKIDTHSSTSYTFSYADLDGSNPNTFTINKDNSIHFVSFSFANGGEMINIEPPKEQWDICFTNYQHFFSNLPLPFVITGVLSNRHSGIKIAEDNANKFASIVLEDTIKYMFTDFQDEIGFDWKIRNSADNSFTIDPNTSFILRDQNGFFYKIRFVDFYNETGSKGYPKFEIQKL